MARKQQSSYGVSRTIRTILGAILVLVITFFAISICQVVGKALKVDITGQRLYTLSKGTKAILGRLHQPVKAKLYYAKTAALKGPDQIRYFNNYYEFVKALLEEYVAVSKGMVELQVIDPRPFSEAEAEAMRYGLTRFPITQEENFFFGLVVQTEFGVEKVIEFFSPDRDEFVEYDISYLIDTAITRQKTSIGIMSSLPVMGDTSYMAQMMRMQGQAPRGPWGFVEQLRSKYEVREVSTDVNDINDVDILLVIHPKDLPEPTLFAIDQFVLKGGRTIVCVDPHCLSDQPPRTGMQMPPPQSQGSDLNALLRTWGLEMPANTFAGDKELAMPMRVRQGDVIGFLGLAPGCFNTDNVITTELNRVTVFFAGALNKVADANQAKAGETRIERTPLVMTTNKGNTFSINSPYELMMNPEGLMNRFYDGTEPVTMGYLITGRFKSSFPNGIVIEPESSDDSSDKPKDPNDEKTPKLATGLKEAQQDCVVVVFSDVDFISDMLAYRNFPPFGKAIVGDNSALMLNTIDDLGGSADLVSIRSRGNFRRPFTVVDRIEREAEEKTAAEILKIDMAIAGFNRELQSIVASAAKGEQEVIGSSIMQKKRALELKIHEANRQKNLVQRKRHESIGSLGNKLQNANTLVAPVVILVIAVVLGIRRSVRKRHYISHASDA